MTDKIGIDEQIAYQKEVLQLHISKGFVVTQEDAILATLRDYKRIREAKVPEPVAWMDAHKFKLLNLHKDSVQSGVVTTLTANQSFPEHAALYGNEVLDLLRRETAKNQKLTLELQSLRSQSMET